MTQTINRKKKNSKNSRMASFHSNECMRIWFHLSVDIEKIDEMSKVEEVLDDPRNPIKQKISWEKHHIET